MASMSSAQIVSATAIHNKLGLPGIPRPAFPGAGVRVSPAPHYWSILSSFTQGSWGPTTQTLGQITLHTTALHNCPYQISAPSKGVGVKITTPTAHGAQSHFDLVTKCFAQLYILCCLVCLLSIYKCNSPVMAGYDIDWSAGFLTRVSTVRNDLSMLHRAGYHIVRFWYKLSTKNKAEKQQENIIYSTMFIFFRLLLNFQLTL